MVTAPSKNPLAPAAKPRYNEARRVSSPPGSTESTEPPASPRGVVVLLLVVLVANAMLRLSLLSVPLERDEGEYAYTAQRMLAGEAPYTVVYTLKFPGSHALYALLMALLGQRIESIRLGLLVANTASILLIFGLGRWYRDAWLGAVAAAAFAALAISPKVLGLSAQTEAFVLPFALGGLLVLVHSLDRRRAWGVLLAGALFGTAMAFKQHGAVYLAMAVSYVGVLAWLAPMADERRPAWRRGLKRMAALAVGAALPLGAMLAAVAWLDNFSTFCFWTFTYARQYVVGESPVSGWDNLQLSLWPILRAGFLIWPLAALGFAAAWHQAARADRREKCKAALLALMALWGVVGLSLGLYFRPHYFMLLLPSVALAAAIGISTLARLIGQGQARRAALTFAILGWTVPLFSMLNQALLLTRFSPDMVARITYGTNPFPEARRIGEYLRQHTEPGEPIAVIGSEPQIYFYADRPAATRYIYTYEMMQPHAYAEPMQREMIAQIEAARPRYLVYVGHPLSWLVRENSRHLINPWFAEYAQAHYDRVGMIEINPGQEAVYCWGDEAATYQPDSAHPWLAVWRRRDSSPQP